MSASIEWLSANFIEVAGAAKPGSFENDGSENEVAAIRITGADGDGVIIEGRPEKLVAIAREFLRTAELIVVATMRDPKLRAMYGILSSTDAMRETHTVLRSAPPSAALVERDDTDGWVELSTPEAADMSEVFAAQEEAERSAIQADAERERDGYGYGRD